MIKLTKEKTDRIVMRSIPFLKEKKSLSEITNVTKYYDSLNSLHCITEIHTKNGILKQHTRQDLDVNTVWVVEHLLKDEDDVKTYLDLPHNFEIGVPDISSVIETEKELGDTGIVMIDTGDALVESASLLSMEEYTVIAMTNPELFTELMKLKQVNLLKKTKIVSELLPNRLWRIYGPEYATPPYLPPYLYEKYVVNFDTDLVSLIKKNGGIARMHQHGNSKDVLRLTLQTGCDGLDPVEPPPQGDITLKEARKICGDKFTLFGNLEINDIEMLPPNEMETKVKTALCEGPDSNGSSFVLMPSASPYGRVLSDTALKNYNKIIDIVSLI